MLKKSNLLIGTITVTSLVCGLLFLLNKNNSSSVKATHITEMSNVGIESDEELDEDNAFYDDFSTGIDSSTWAISERKWGGNNGGVRHENLFYDGVNQRAIFRALGDQYEGNEFYNSNPDAYTTDGKRTGAAIFTKQEFGPGRYEIKMRAAPKIGVCTAFWTYGNYNDMYSEIDIEMPVHDYFWQEDDYRFVFNKMICTSWIGENETTEKSSENASLGEYVNNGEFHSYAFDWYYSNNNQKVDWFIDGQKVKTIYSNIPSYSARLWVGCWLPANQYFIGMPDFDKAYMDVDYVKFTPFKNQIDVKMNAPLSSQISNIYPTSSTLIHERNLLANGDFDYNSLSMFNVTNNVEISSDYNHHGASSYGVKISNNGSTNNKLSYTLNVEGMDSLIYKFNYKGYGAYSIDYYGGGDLSPYRVSEGIPGSPGEWSNVERNVNIPEGAVNAVVALNSESSTGLIADNWFFGYIDENVEPIDNDGDSYSFSSTIYSDYDLVGWGEKTFSPKGDNTKLWKLAGGKYYNYNGDIDTLALTSNMNVMNSTSGSVYYPVRQALLDNEIATASQKVYLLCQQFDLAFFKDIEVSFYAKLFNNVAILYSIDQGSSWNLLKFKTAGAIPSSGDASYKYIISASYTDLLNPTYDTIRFAITGLQTAEDSSRLVSVIINNANDFKNNLDLANMCSASAQVQSFLAREYSKLNADELNDLATSTMKYYSQSYMDGYNYLLSYWSGGQLNRVNYENNETKNEVVIVIILTSLFAVSLLGAYFLIIRKKKLH